LPFKCKQKDKNTGENFLQFPIDILKFSSCLLLEYVRKKLNFAYPSYYTLLFTLHNSHHCLFLLYNCFKITLRLRIQTR